MEGLYSLGSTMNLSSFDVPPFQMIEFPAGMGDSFIDALVIPNPDSIAVSTAIRSTNILDRREAVLLMVMSCVLV